MNYIMMFYLGPVLIGFMSVLQIALNRSIGHHLGLGFVLLVNAFTIIFVACCLFTAICWVPSWFDIFFIEKNSALLEILKCWYFLPVLFGFTLILGLPFYVNKTAALSVLIIFIAAQALISMLWDNIVHGIPLTIYKLMGVFLTIFGVALVSK